MQRRGFLDKSDPVKAFRECVMRAKRMTPRCGKRWAAMGWAGVLVPEKRQVVSIWAMLLRVFCARNGQDAGRLAPSLRQR